MKKLILKFFLLFCKLEWGVIDDLFASNLVFYKILWGKKYIIDQFTFYVLMETLTKEQYLMAERFTCSDFHYDASNL